MVLGQGGIGSWLTLLLARTGATLYTVDFDKFEDHNVAGQIFLTKDIGEAKTQAVANLIKETCGEDRVNPLNEMVSDDEDAEWFHNMQECDIVCVSFDNIKTRSIVFDKWTRCGKSKSLFVDGRMGVQNGEVFTVEHGNVRQISFYNSSLFDDNDIEPLPCTAKATSHCGALIAALAVTQITNWLARDTGFPAIPLNHQEFHLPINYFKDHVVADD